MVVVGMALVTIDGSQDASAPTRTWVHGVPTTEVDLSSLTTARHITAAARPARASTVALVVDRRGKTTVATGVVAEAGGIVVALEPLLHGARTITVIEPDGTRESAVRVGTDTPTGITVLRIDDDLQAAAFATEDPATGSVAVAMTEERDADRGSAPAVRLYAGTVLWAGVAGGTDSGASFCATGVEAPLSAGDLGSPLVDARGAVAGILDRVEGEGTSRTAVFLPAELVADVAAQIVDHGSVDHGSLDAETVDTSTGSGTTGAVVDAVTSGGAAARAGLRPGDVVEAVDGRSVRSVAELATRLYGDSPGTDLVVTVHRGVSTFAATVVLDDA
jgi:S1-C subfamily serine protease